ncbi:hypothetical protein ABH944_009128, partial [Caballeronia udeis]
PLILVESLCSCARLESAEAVHVKGLQFSAAPRVPYTAERHGASSRNQLPHGQLLSSDINHYV